MSVELKDMKLLHVSVCQNDEVSRFGAEGTFWINQFRAFMIFFPFRIILRNSTGRTDIGTNQFRFDIKKKFDFRLVQRSVTVKYFREN